MRLLSLVRKWIRSMTVMNLFPVIFLLLVLFSGFLSFVSTVLSLIFDKRQVFVVFLSVCCGWCFGFLVEFFGCSGYWLAGKQKSVCACRFTEICHDTTIWLIAALRRTWISGDLERHKLCLDRWGVGSVQPLRLELEINRSYIELHGTSSCTESEIRASQMTEDVCFCVWVVETTCCIHRWCEWWRW